MTKNLYLLLLVLLAVACRKNENLTIRQEENNLEAYFEAEHYLKPGFEHTDYRQQLPEYLRAVGLNPRTVDNQKAALGRILFYDKNLSRDGSISCASCHQQNRAFADGVAFSKGIEGQQGSRNAMAIANVAHVSAHYSLLNGTVPPFLWDNRATSIIDLSKMAFTNDHEMGMTMSQVVEQVKKQPYYDYSWKTLFGNFEVTEEQVLDCISEFVGAIGSYHSKLDHALTKANGNINLNVPDTIKHLYYGTTTIVVGLPGFTASENSGRDIFVAHCTKCHSAIRPFQEVFAACNGLEMDYKDAGLSAITGRPKDVGVFKSPSLRNIGLTAPYMHDGRFKTLEEVVEFYNSGIQMHPNLHPLLRQPDGGTQLHLNATEKADLVAFLHTLDDWSLAKDQRFSNPFK